MAKISGLKPREFTINEINDCIYVDYVNGGEKSIVKMSTIFDWIKTEANKNGLTVQMNDERIMFIIGDIVSTLCDCKYPLVRTGSDNSEYCGFCHKDL